MLRFLVHKKGTGAQNAIEEVHSISIQEVIQDVIGVGAQQNLNIFHVQHGHLLER